MSSTKFFKSLFSNEISIIFGRLDELNHLSKKLTILSLDLLHNLILSGDFVVKNCLRSSNSLSMFWYSAAFFLKILHSFIGYARGLLIRLSNFAKILMRYSVFLGYIIYLSIPESMASFEVEPLKLNINLNNKSVIINVKNRDYKKQFSVELINLALKKTSDDLVITPTSFALEPDKTQTIRIMTKDGIKYSNNAYYIYLKTRNADSKKIEGVNAFKIPVSFGDVEEPKLDKKLDNLASKLSGGGGGEEPVSSVNTQVRIVVPVSARVSK